MNWLEILSDFFTYGILIYSISLLSFYIFIGIYSIGEVRTYLRKNSFADYRVLAVSNQAPSISILAPAYNEGATVIENVRSLLSIHYNNVEVIIINDGSKDDSLQKLINAYHLEKIDFFVNEQIPAKRVRGVYKSTNPVYRKLIVVDKENGGKADALNVGINISSNDYIVCIDVDCVLEQDALLKLAKPFLEATKERVIATGGVVRIANGCEIEDGRLVKVKLAKEFLPRVQTLEYIRAFLLGRMAWSRMNGLLLISGAFGAFDKEIAIKCGGYNHKTVGEDMELVVRMRRYMEEQNVPYRVTFIPDPLCWTEAPASFKILGRQRNRWTRGTIETLNFHKVMFFNPKYRILGMISYPYWFFYEFLAPIVEFVGFVAFIIFGLLGLVDWLSFLYLLGFIMSFGFLYSAFAILMEVLTYNQYKDPKDVLRLLKTAFLEPFIFHPFVVWSAIKGNIDLIQKKNSWGEMTRQGFAAKPGSQPAATTPAEPTVVMETAPVTEMPPEPELIPSEPEKIEIKPKFSFFSKLLEGTGSFASISISWLVLILLFSIYEIGFVASVQQLPEELGQIATVSAFNSMMFWLKFNIIIYLPFILFYFLSRRFSRIFLSILVVLFGILQFTLVQYFSASLLPLGADLYGYSLKDIEQTLGASGSVSNSSIALFGGCLILAFCLVTFLPRVIKINNYVAFLLPLISIIVLTAGTRLFHIHPFKSDYANSLTLNKSDFFYTESYKYFFPEDIPGNIYKDAGLNDRKAGFKYIDPENYPFLHEDVSKDVLSPFFNKSEIPPNIVIILVEGLGRAFTNEGAYLGNFTPFLDSLAGKSLYWKNFLSQGGRTFAVLPSVLGSLPFAKNGFLEMDTNMPKHLSLVSILKANGYKSNFFYGGEADFDNMNKFLHANAIDKIYDSKTFPAGYTKLPSKGGFSWGYGDHELYRNYFNTLSASNSPSLNVLLTISTHSPFLVNEQEKYIKAFEDRIKELRFDEKKVKAYREDNLKYASILFADDALRKFFNQYSKRNDFSNTIFLITGDHRMPELAMSSKIDRYHVPLIIYSPLLKRTAEFESVSSHYDITPSLLAYLNKNYAIRKPSLTAMIGEGLDTAKTFRNIHAYPLMQTKTDLLDFIQDGYHLNSETLFKLSSSMDEDIVIDEAKLKELKASFGEFKQRNNKLQNGAKLIPDSLYQKYFPK